MKINKEASKDPSKHANVVYYLKCLNFDED